MMGPRMIRGKLPPGVSWSRFHSGDAEEVLLNTILPPKADVPFLRGAVRPMECYRLGWGLIEKQYLLFLGITLVGVLLASYAPLGILMGPMLCGVYHCYLRKIAGETVTFGALFKGFDHFLQSLLATIPIFLASMVSALVVVAVVFFEVFGVVLGAEGQARILPDAGPWFVFGAVALVSLSFVVLMALVLIPLAILTTFTYPLIMDRNLPGFDALRMSARAGMANAGGLAGLFLLNLALGLVGMCFCYVGALLLLPLNFAALAVAYRQVFPSQETAEGPEPPPPPPR